MAGEVFGNPQRYTHASIPGGDFARSRKPLRSAHCARLEP
jgi:hypothetical protein